MPTRMCRWTTMQYDPHSRSFDSELWTQKINIQRERERDRQTNKLTKWMRLQPPRWPGTNSWTSWRPNGRWWPLWGPVAWWAPRVCCWSSDWAIGLTRPAQVTSPRSCPRCTCPSPTCRKPFGSSKSPSSTRGSRHSSKHFCHDVMASPKCEKRRRLADSFAFDGLRSNLEEHEAMTPFSKIWPKG